MAEKIYSIQPPCITLGKEMVSRMLEKDEKRTSGGKAIPVRLPWLAVIILILTGALIGTYMIQNSTNPIPPGKPSDVALGNPTVVGTTTPPVPLRSDEVEAPMKQSGVADMETLVRFVEQNPGDVEGWRKVREKATEIGEYNLAKIAEDKITRLGPRKW